MHIKRQPYSLPNLASIESGQSNGQVPQSRQRDVPGESQLADLCGQELVAYLNGVVKTQQRCVRVSRPRRFGNSTAANMLVSYCDRTCDSLDTKRLADTAADAYASTHAPFVFVIDEWDAVFPLLGRLVPRARDPKSVTVTRLALASRAKSAIWAYTLFIGTMRFPPR